MRTLRRHGFKLLLWAVPVGLGIGVVLIVAAVIFAIATGGRYMGGSEEAGGAPSSPTSEQSMTPPNGDTANAARASGCLSHAQDPATQLTQLRPNTCKSSG